MIDDIYDFAEAQGFEIDTIIQESGAGQIEINLHHGDPIALADQVFFTNVASEKPHLKTIVLPRLWPSHAEPTW